MKILGLISGTEGYGVRRAWLGLSDQFIKNGIDLIFASVNEGTLAKELKENNFEVVTLLNKKFKNVPSGNLKLFYLVYRIYLQLTLIPKLLKIIKKNKINAILFRSPLEVFLMGFVARMAGIKSFWLMPNSVSANYPLDLNRKIYRFFFKYMNIVPIANSKYTLSTLGKIPTGYYTHLGIDPELFVHSSAARVKIRSDLNLIDSDILIGIFARMTPEKGQSMMIDALNASCKDLSNVHLILCGSGNDKSYQSEIEDKVKDYGLIHRVHLMGAVNNVVDYYCACDIIANTRLDAEPFGFSVIEAMMLGKPVLAHKLGGPGETVLDGITGWHIHEPTLNGFKEGIKRCLDSRNQWTEYSKQSAIIAEQYYTSEIMAKRLINIISQV